VEPTAPLLDVQNLTLALPSGADRARAVSEVSFTVMPGRVTCLVGESGSGKSVCAQAAIGLLPRAIRPAGGRILFEGMDLLRLSSPDWRKIRGRRIAMVFQEPMTALNPVMPIGAQVAEMFEAHRLLSSSARRQRVLALLDEVGLPDPAAAARAFPHQLSGGQRQRAMIAMALALDPALLVADEPTTALDVTTQAQILRLIREVQTRRGTGVLFITHDLGVVRDIADQVVVMQGGRSVEAGRMRDVLDRPRHAYTKALIAAMPGSTPPERGAPDQRVLLEVAGLSKTYSTRAGWFRPARTVHAVRNVSFTIARGETLGVVGESGSGKSTLARLVTRLLEADAGTIRLDGTDLREAGGQSLRRLRRQIPVVFQDPFASLNPRRRVGDSIMDGAVADGMQWRQARAEARRLLEQVGLQGSAGGRYPHEFSGGQRQRIGIARALAMRPDIIVADEPVSALDVSVQAQVLALLDKLKRTLQLSMLFITHDLNVAAQICDRIAVMRRGEIVEIGQVRQVLGSPSHPYTKILIDAAPGRAALGVP
jgi:peptide/nickel transport system ATP-binding protein